MAQASEDGRAIVKTMSLTYDDFSRSIAVLAEKETNPRTSSGQTVRLSLYNGHVDIGFEKLPDARLGGLLNLPRARITLSFTGVDQEAAQKFVKRFDQAFRRGGG